MSRLLSRPCAERPCLPLLLSSKLGIACREQREKSTAERPTRATSATRPRNAARKREAQRGRRWRCAADSLGRRSGLLAVFELLRTARRGVGGVLQGHARPVVARSHGPREQALGSAARRSAPPKGRYRGPVEPDERVGSRGSGRHPPPREGPVQRRPLPRFWRSRDAQRLASAVANPVLPLR
eukprot:COSAG06_NODE_7723_length_2398_cov_5.069161_4_plen_183_part_00